MIEIGPMLAEAIKTLAICATISIVGYAVFRTQR